VAPVTSRSVPTEIAAICNGIVSNSQNASWRQVNLPNLQYDNSERLEDNEKSML